MAHISIITATFNAEDTVRDCLHSVQVQHSVSVEHIVIDGGSTDRTVDIVERSNHVAQLVSEPDNGIYDAMNKGLGLARGDIIGILNGDDLYTGSDTLSKVVEVFSDPRVAACYGDLEYVKECEASGARGEEREFKTVRYWKSGAFDPQKFYWGWMPPHPTFFVRREVYEMYGVFNLNLGSAADYELMLRFLVKHGVRAAYIPKVLVKMRMGGVSNATVGNRLAANRMDRKAWAVNGLRPYPWTLTMKPLRKLGQWIFTEER